MTSVAQELRCSHCGAHAARASARYCEYCGKAMPGTESRPPTPDELLQRRFEELENHPELQRHLQWTPGPEVLRHGLRRNGWGLVVLFLMLAFLVPGFRHGPGPIAVFPWILIGIVAVQLVRRNRFVSAPLERLVSVVVDERQQASGAGDSGTRTEYFATLETRDGARRELEVSGPLAGEIRPGDMGVAYAKGDLLVAFRRLRV